MNMLKMIGKIKEVLTWVWIAVIGTAICVNVCAQTPQEWKGLERQLNFYMANDLQLPHAKYCSVLENTAGDVYLPTLIPASDKIEVR